MIKISEAIYYHKLNMKVSITVCEKAGDGFFDNPLSRIGFSAGQYVRRHYITSGSLRAYYPDTEYKDELLVPTTVWPFDDHKEVDNYKVIALEDNSSFYCFLPIGTARQVLHEFNEVKAGEKFVAKQGKIYSPSVDYYVNGEFKKAFGIVVCSEGDLVIELKKDGLIAAFYATYI